MKKAISRVNNVFVALKLLENRDASDAWTAGLGPAPHWYGGLSGGHSSTAGLKVGAGLQTLRSELQTHKAELDLAARTDDVLAARFVVLHFLPTGGTGPDRGHRLCPLHLLEVG